MVEDISEEGFEKKRIQVREIWEAHNTSVTGLLKQALFLELDFIKTIIGWATGIASIGIPLLLLSNGSTAGALAPIALIILISVIVYGIFLYKFHLSLLQKKLQSQLNTNNQKFSQALALAHAGIKTPSKEISNQINEILIGIVEKKKPTWKAWLEKFLGYFYYFLFVLGVTLLALSFVSSNTGFSWLLRIIGIHI